ncbi:MAG: ScyD/ScyE family protein [Caldilineales bacterium]
MRIKSLVSSLALSCLIILSSGSAYAMDSDCRGLENVSCVQSNVTRLVTGLDGGSGSAIGPGNALYVPETNTGKIWRIDPRTGAKTLFASGLPQQIPGVGIGGVMDVAFLGGKAYALVTLVSPDVGGSDIDGIYRIDGPDSYTVIADIGAFSTANPPSTSYEIPTGVQYALQTYRGGFLVTDGHHNRVLRVTLDGDVSEVIAFGDIVPTGLATLGNTVYMAEAGPIPHNPQDGQIVSFNLQSPNEALVASGASLLVDVEFGRGLRLYGLSQGIHTTGGPGTPADHDTGALVEVNRDGTFTVITDGLDQPTSMEFIGNTAYVVTLPGDVLEITDVAGPPYGRFH